MASTAGVALLLLLSAAPPASALAACSITNVQENPHPNGDFDASADFNCPGTVKGELRINEQVRLSCSGVLHCRITGTVVDLHGCVTVQWFAYTAFAFDPTAVHTAPFSYCFP